MVYNRFSSHSTHNSLESFHHLKQSTSIVEYILKFEEMMSLMQMEYPGPTEQHFVSSFITGLKEGIKHYLIPHILQSLCDVYWKAKELEKGILVKKSLLTPTSFYTKSTNSYTPHKPQTLPQPTLPHNPQPQAKPIPIKPKEQGKCWGCNENWTPGHKFVCKFRLAINVITVQPEDWLAMEQMMENDNHSLLEAEVTDPPIEQPQLLMISSHVARGTSSSATFSIIMTIASKKGIVG
jgi:hypothetical protein